MSPRTTLLALVVLAGLGGPARADDPLPPRQVKPGWIGTSVPEGWVEHRAAATHPSAAYRWLQVMLEASGRSVDRNGARPTIISREMAIVVTAMYDAWAAYDDKAVGTRLGGTLRRPPAERTAANKERAIGTAAYRALLYVYPEDAAWLAEQMKAMGGDPAQETTALTRPEGVGNTAAAAVIAYRRHDGSNQEGDEAGSAGKPYSDYTFYEPRSPPGVIVDPDRWQPIPFDDGKGGVVHPGFLTPHWYRVKPFALERSNQFRGAPFPRVGSPELLAEVDEAIAFNGHLTAEQKSIVELMRDGPRSTGQSGHWLQFAQDVSRRDGYDLDRDIKLFFAVANVAFDGFIACWESKRFYDSARPYTLVRHLYKGKQIIGYLGPGKGFGPLPANKWHPYSPSTFVTPPFPGYPSGHSTVSSASATILALATGSDRYQAYVRHDAGKWTEPGTASKPVILLLPTFTDTAEMAGLSRVMGGYHIYSDNAEGLRLGKKVAEWSWTRYRQYWDGTAPPPRP